MLFELLVDDSHVCRHLAIAACLRNHTHLAHPQVIGLCEKPRQPQPRHIVADTPGQIEIFTWSASGAIITEAFASSFPTMVAYVIDTPRCIQPQVFMSNMLQASGPAHRNGAYHDFRDPECHWRVSLLSPVRCR